ncbi:TPA: DEAD/DEAH box helicase, partial [Candidatus Woesearchaeota archaeon]|nr:DEAD/DEAH box helicase [Candidatus Woesearchaeota archaeon]
MQYKQFTLDPFQEEAINSFLNNHSVVVSAATGTGKTLIADYIIDTDIKEGKRIIYTAPIKALSNQKFKQFRHEYGDDKVGMMTGDIVINPTAQVLIMTTEIYRNMLMTNDPSISDVSYVVFDEIHFLSDVERGTVWEESIIFSPDNVRFLCLSATIPNAREFADWIQTIKHHTVDVVEFSKRAVPLAHYVFDTDLGITDLEEVRKKAELDRMPEYDQVMGLRRGKKGRKGYHGGAYQGGQGSGGHGAFMGKKARKAMGEGRAPTHLDLVNELQATGGLPTMFFVFSRMATEIKAKETARNKNFLTAAESAEVVNYMQGEIRKSPNADQIFDLKTTKLLQSTIRKGVAFHHAGVLPKLKDIIEHLFEQGMIKVLYATETFAVGINMPAKTVCFNSLDKFDGRGFRYLTSQEYFQIAGRAGRRGIDKEGKAIALIDRKFANFKKIRNITTGKSEPIVSQFKMSVNSVLNIIGNHDDSQIDTILTANFGCFQAGSSKAIALTKASYQKKRKILEMMEYLQKSKHEGRSFALTWKGQFATHVYTQEMLVTEIFFNDLWKDLDNYELTLIVAAIVYEEKKNDSFRVDIDTANIRRVLKALKRDSYAFRTINKAAIKRLAFIVWKWASGCEFQEMMQYTNLLEGDLIRLFRQCIDLMKQVKSAARAADKDELVTRMDSCIDSIKREFV